MKAVKGTYRNGRIKLAEKPDEPGPVEVVVVFPETEEDPWEAILNEKKLRPAFAKFVDQCKKDIAAGKAKPLKLSQL